jgi:transcriptional regulator with XRE-family HTH domain/predicted XRE-type DNA-binding protein
MLAKSKNRRDNQRRRVGRRVRRRRLFMGKTQAWLADSLGITFQQIQKYENGRNAVPEDRLKEIAILLDISPGYFSATEAAAEADALERFVESKEGLSLCRAITRIPEGNTRAALVAAVAAFSESHSKPEGSAGALSWLRNIAGNKDAKRSQDIAEAVRTMKVELARVIGNALAARKLTQTFAAQILRTDQARISTLARGNVAATSLERLLRYLMLLGWDASLGIAKRPINRLGKIELTVRDR